jgi:hydroxypyruvate reductase
MSQPTYEDHVAHYDAIREAALRAGDPGVCVHEHLRVSGRRISAGKYSIELTEDARIYLIAFGKASPGMTSAALEILDGLPTEGIVVVPNQMSIDLPPSIRVITAGHPLPTLGSFEAGEAAIKLLSKTRDQDLVLVLISGGGSAMLELPTPPITLDDLRQINNMLLRSGAQISEVNTVRKSISRIKAGGLARHAYPARVLSLILSDVIGDQLSMVASGPTVLRRPSPGEAGAILQRYQLSAELPQSVHQAILQRKSAVSPSRRPINVLIGNNRKVVEAAAQQAAALGFKPRILTTRAQGEAREVARKFAKRLLASRPGVCLLMGGETTVTVTGDGLGGRNQEFALACALAIEGREGVAVMCLATDGIDGPTDAAGALVDGKTAARARNQGMSPEGSLARNDSYHLFDQLGVLVRTGPTGTNLNDLVVGLRFAR